MSMVDDDVWDVAIVGAGPAGSVAALAALAERPGTGAADDPGASRATRLWRWHRPTCA
jgi:cation diffusion facilitator CzcD-associated flavoprotein CzcO